MNYKMCVPCLLGLEGPIADELKRMDMADVVSDEAFTPDTNVVFDGYFHESEFRSAPYFNIMYIDGITEK